MSVKTVYGKYKKAIHYIVFSLCVVCLYMAVYALLYLSGFGVWLSMAVSWITTVILVPGAAAGNRVFRGKAVKKQEKPREPQKAGAAGNEEDFEHLADGNKLLGTKPVLKNSKINFKGRNNILFCEENVRLINSSLTFQGNDSVIYLSSNKHEYKLNVTVYHNSVFFAGKNNYFNGILNAVLSECRHVLIGAEGLFSFDIWIRNADPHLVYQCETKKRLNPTQSIFIGEHVWVGQSAMILKGSRIGAGSIIGAMSLVAGKEIPPNSSWGGNPVKLLKEGIFWEGSCVHSWTPEQTAKRQSYQDDKYIFADKSASVDYDEIDRKLSEAVNAKERLDYLQEVRKNFESC